MSKAGSSELIRVTNFFFLFVLIISIIFSYKVVEAVDTGRSTIGYSGADKVSVKTPQSYSFNNSSKSIRLEFLHPNLYENAKWQEIIALDSDMATNGLNITLELNPKNQISYQLENNGKQKSFNTTEGFHTLLAGDKLTLTFELGSDCVDCVSVSYYNIWNFVGLLGSIDAKFSISILSWGKNYLSIIVADIVLTAIIGLIWVISKKSLSNKGFGYY